MFSRKLGQRLLASRVKANLVRMCKNQPPLRTIISTFPPKMLTNKTQINVYRATRFGCYLRKFSEETTKESESQLDKIIFNNEADTTLEDCSQVIEEALEGHIGEELDVTYSVRRNIEELESETYVQDGILTINLGDFGTYVLNKQTPNRQIWFSSPVR
jgi:frataxin-like iron-binding protein CyaY